MKTSLFYRNLTVLDYAYMDKEHGPMGGSLNVNVTFYGTLDDEGILYDFSYAKKKVKEIIDRDCDHRLVVSSDDVCFENGQGYLKYKYGKNNSVLEYWGPDEGFCAVDGDANKNLKEHLEKVIVAELPENIERVELEFVEENNKDDNFYYHYTHGLKDHYGNCQRLFHGHRNTVEVIEDGNRSRKLEEVISKEWVQDTVHLCFWENVVNKEEIQKALNIELPIGRFEKLPTVHIKYKSIQGVFESKVPGELIYMMPIESTVENISAHFFTRLKERFPGRNFSVRAFEGVGKGAITR